MCRVTLPVHARVRLGANVAAARGDRKRSAIASSLDSSREAIAQIERGQRAPSIEWLALLADALATTVSDLLDGVLLIDPRKR